MWGMEMSHVPLMHFTQLCSDCSVHRVERVVTFIATRHHQTNRQSSSVCGTETLLLHTRSADCLFARRRHEGNLKLSTLPAWTDPNDDGTNLTLGLCSCPILDRFTFL